ncbi:serine/threonine-protein kinase [Paracidovorax anthurii]|nr:serine/threonine-protein kinase [Paracidovorax anthurii]
MNLDAAAAELCNQRGFEFLGPLGQGAFKSAYLAAYNSQQFALKLAVAAGATERLVREARALQECSHNSVARLLQAHPHITLEGGELWVVCEEYLAGGTLQSRRTCGVLSVADTRAIGVALAEVLGHLHEKRLVHRDIKPENIMFRDRSNAHPVLTDFGIVRMLNQPTLTQAFAQMGPGTPAYAAPEQLTNDKALIDWRTDQFDLAIVLAECLLGHHPFLASGKTIPEAIMAVAARHEMPAENAARLAALGFGALRTALKPWPIARFRNPSDFLESLKTSS